VEIQFSESSDSRIKAARARAGHDSIRNINLALSVQTWPRALYESDQQPLRSQAAGAKTAKTQMV